MRTSCTKLLYFAGAAAMLLLSVPASAASLTLLGSSTPGYPSYDGTYATDSGPNHLNTDYASSSQGTATHLDFAISGSTNHIDVYDRTTSGGPNLAYYGGTTDFTTEFELIFSNNSDFSSPLATYDFTKTTPASPTGPSSFLYSATFATVNADYVRYQVIAANGPNPGVADISFSSVPEPSGLVLLGTGAFGVVGMLRRKMSGK